jgi:hypothetical protein
MDSWENFINEEVSSKSLNSCIHLNEVHCQKACRLALIKTMLLQIIIQSLKYPCSKRATCQIGYSGTSRHHAPGEQIRTDPTVPIV